MTLLQVVETAAAVTWSFFAMPAIHLDEEMPALQVCARLHAHRKPMGFFSQHTL